MHDDVQLMDPAVEELLRDIADDPNSCLLRIPRPRLLTALSRGELPDRSDETGLSAAERELTRRYRCEVAYLLRVTCAKLLTERPENAMFVSKPMADGREIELPGDRAWRRSLRRSLRFDRPNVDEPTVVELLLRCVNDSSESLPSVAELAIASLRLESTPQARIYIAIDRILHGEEGRGISALRTVLARKPGTAIASCAWQNIGMGYARSEDHVLALEAYAAAANYDAGRPLPAVRCLVSAVRLGDHSAARRWASVVDQWPRDHIAIYRVVEQVSAQRRAGRWFLTAEAAACASGLGVDGEAASRSIAGVFA